jgi:hypothetical protein
LDEWYGATFAISPPSTLESTRRGVDRHGTTFFRLNSRPTRLFVEPNPIGHGGVPRLAGEINDDDH